MQINNKQNKNPISTAKPIDERVFAHNDQNQFLKGPQCTYIFHSLIHSLTHSNSFSLSLFLSFDF